MKNATVLYSKPDIQFFLNSGRSGSLACCTLRPFSSCALILSY
jgi:hypothetical protein